ncbi:MAG: hypothetical protein ACLT4C_08375 [Butyricicoccus sp.]
MSIIERTAILHADRTGVGRRYRRAHPGEENGAFTLQHNDGSWMILLLGTP